MSEIVTKAKGNVGEDNAASFLKKKGYRIIGRNVYVSKKELDIIAENSDTVIFVEVKTRIFPARFETPYAYSRPANAVTLKKRKNVVYAAIGYLKKNPIRKRCRFDVIEVYFAEYPDKSYKLHKINHIESAFDAYGNII